MKTPLFFIAAFAAFLVLPLDFVATMSVLFSAGIAAIVMTDYRSRVPALRLQVAAATVGVGRHERLRLAA